LTTEAEMISFVGAAPYPKAGSALLASDYLLTFDVSLRKTATPGTAGACYVGGCSGEVCSDQPNVASNCMYKSEFACYKKASTCETTNYWCVWMDTDECIGSVPCRTIVIKSWILGRGRVYTLSYMKNFNQEPISKLKSALSPEQIRRNVANNNGMQEALDVVLHYLQPGSTNVEKLDLAREKLTSLRNDSSHVNEQSKEVQEKHFRLERGMVKLIRYLELSVQRNEIDEDLETIRQEIINDSQEIELQFASFSANGPVFEDKKEDPYLVAAAM
jgi:hypothetical protein